LEEIKVEALEVTLKNFIIVNHVTLILILPRQYGQIEEILINNSCTSHDLQDRTSREFVQEAPVLLNRQITVPISLKTFVNTKLKSIWLLN